MVLPGFVFFLLFYMWMGRFGVFGRLFFFLGRGGGFGGLGYFFLGGGGGVGGLEGVGSIFGIFVPYLGSFLVP